jgi:RNA polymerase sigma-70 factor (ECF subfamily)
MTDSVATFTDLRPLLFSIAYRMLGSVMEAEDIVQEAFLRWQGTSTTEVENPKAFLSSVVTRLCIDHLRSAQVRRESYYGPWLPEPLITDPRESPAGALALDESLSMAFLRLLEALTPDERAVFLLREVFDYGYAEIGQIVGKSEAACRQLLARGRQHIANKRPRYDVTREEQQQVTSRFLEACATGDLNALMAVLGDTVTATADGGGVVSAATRTVTGADRVARYLLGLLAHMTQTGVEVRLMEVNGEPGVILYFEGKVFAVISLHIEDGRIQQINTVANPEKLQGIPPMDS